MTAVIVLTAVLAVAISLIYQYILYPAVLSPLANLPHAHWSCRCSGYWLQRHSDLETDNEAIHHAHETLGPIVRIGKNEISVNHIEGVKAIYNGFCNRDSWYEFAENYGVPNMFSFTEKAPHTARRRMLGNVYAKSTLQRSYDIPMYADSLIKRRLLPLIHSSMQQHGAVNVMPLFLSFATDFVSSYAFGSAFTADILGKEEEKLSESTTSVPVTTASNGARNDTTGLALASIEKIGACDGKLDSGELRTTKPIVYNRLAQALSNDAGSPDARLLIASELQDHVIAGTESSGWTMTYVVHELSRRPALQVRLRDEVHDLRELHTDSELFLTSATVQALDKLSFLEAIIMETMRVHPGIAGSQPRVTPRSSDGLTILGYSVPPGTVLSAQAYSLHRNADVFPHPEIWDPFRWIHVSANKKAEMQQWFWAFGSGPRMCIGNNFALLELKLVVASIFFNFSTYIVKDEGIEQGGGYSAGPRSEKILFGFSKIGRESTDRRTVD